MSNIRLCYFGGSGGFVALHLLLASNQFDCAFTNGIPFEDVIKTHWDINNHRDWKHSEIWPDNNSTRLLDSDKRKIYFFCNPTVDNIADFDGDIIFVYTDVCSQIELARYKKAFIYHPLADSRIAYYKKHLFRWRKFYNKIKDDQWPKCTSPRKIKQLPYSIQKELENMMPEINVQPYSTYLSNFTPVTVPSEDDLINSATTIANGDQVIASVAEFVKHATDVIKLQHLINNLNLLTAVTGATVNQHQIDIRNKWVTLHPQWLLDKIKINCFL